MENQTNRKGFFRRSAPKADSTAGGINAADAGEAADGFATDGGKETADKFRAGKETFPSGRKAGVVLSPAEAEEYCRFKRQKRISEAAAAMTKSELYAADRDLTAGEFRRIAEAAGRLGAAAVRVTPVYAAPMRNALENGRTVVDCVIGGTGETLSKAKAYETKLAVRAGAKEITLMLCLSALKAAKTGDTKREIKRVRRAAKKVPVKVVADKRLSYAEILRVAKLAGECGARYLSVSYFPDCERLKRDLRDSCMLEVTGVENAADYKAMTAAGVERIGTAHAEEIFSVLLKEAENISFAVDLVSDATEAPRVPVGKETSLPATDSAVAVVVPTDAAENVAALSAATSSVKGSKKRGEQMTVLPDKKPLKGVGEIP